MIKYNGTLKVLIKSQKGQMGKSTNRQFLSDIYLLIDLLLSQLVLMIFLLAMD